MKDIAKDFQHYVIRSHKKTRYTGPPNEVTLRKKKKERIISLQILSDYF